MEKKRRVLFLIAAVAKNAYNTWWQANLDPEGGAQTFTAGLNASGLSTDPVTAYWSCGVYTESELKKIALKLAQVSGLTLPDWDTMTLGQKAQWFSNNKAAILSAGKVRFLVLDNNGDSVDVASILAAANLKPISSIPT